MYNKYNKTNYVEMFTIVRNWMIHFCVSFKRLANDKKDVLNINYYELNHDLSEEKLFSVYEQNLY